MNAKILLDILSAAKPGDKLKITFKDGEDKSGLRRLGESDRQCIRRFLKLAGDPFDTEQALSFQLIAAGSVLDAVASHGYWHVMSREITVIVEGAFKNLEHEVLLIAPVIEAIGFAGRVPETKYGWYSAKCAAQRAKSKRYPTIYEGTKGRRLAVTDVTDTAVEDPVFLWDDLRFVGAVTECLRDNEGNWLLVDDVQQGPLGDKYDDVTCPDCGGTDTEVRNHSLRWHDGQVHCLCGRYLREYDAG